MANVKITNLAAYTDPASTDVLPIVDVGADVTKKVSVADLLKNASSGTAAAPGIAFDGDNTGTGIYRPGAGQLAISTSGTGRLFISDDGKVGIGVSDPSSYNTSADDLVIADPNGFNSGISINITDSTGFSSIWFGDSHAEGRGQISYGHGSADSLSFWVGGNQNLALYESGALVHIGGGSIVSPAVSLNGSAPSNSLVIDSLGNTAVGGDLTVAGNLAVEGDTTTIETTSLVVNSPLVSFGSMYTSGRLLVGTSSDAGGALFQVNDDRIRIASSKTPTSASATGTAGEICWDSSYIYVCTATNTWKRAALSTW